MAMTREAKAAKYYILELLARQGYKKYAQLFKYFDLELTRRDKVVGYMIPDEMTIVINANLHDEEYASVVVRHEILHQYLDHMNRIIAHMGKDQYEARTSTIQELINIAADYEISNRGYTDSDKEHTRQLRIGARTVTCLVTEDQHPDWVNLTMEQMFDELMKNAPQPPKEPQKPKYKEVHHTDEYINGFTKAIRDYKAGRIIYDPESKCFVDRHGNPISLNSIGPEGVDYND